MGIPKLNGKWHEKHPMPPHASLDQRVEWHLAHVQACGCRGISRSVEAELRVRGINLPIPRAPRGIDLVREPSRKR
jgi:hypothetical protein